MTPRRLVAVLGPDEAARVQPCPDQAHRQFSDNRTSNADAIRSLGPMWVCACFDHSFGAVPAGSTIARGLVVVAGPTGG
jgi:hypothetical protein